MAVIILLRSLTIDTPGGLHFTGITVIQGTIGLPREDTSIRAPIITTGTDTGIHGLTIIPGDNDFREYHRLNTTNELPGPKAVR